MRERLIWYARMMTNMLCRAADLDLAVWHVEKFKKFCHMGVDELLLLGAELVEHGVMLLHVQLGRRSSSIHSTHAALAWALSLNSTEATPAASSACC